VASYYDRLLVSALSRLSVRQLQSLAKEYGASSITRLTDKGQLIEAFKKYFGINVEESPRTVLD
jgi:hypothetical protein